MLRKDIEELEKRLLSPLACLSIASKGRAVQEKKDEYRTEFQRDADRIIYSRAFRRLQHKTQVFIAPKGDHYRNRLTHTLEVMAIARSISRALRLNTDLTEAIALGHDLGHSPFGHTGEDALNEKVKEYNPLMHFHHPEQSLRVVDVLERRTKADGKTVFGLNLTYETREGILKHSKGLRDISEQDPTSIPTTLEGQVARIADRIAYIHHDLDDAIRAKIISENDIPQNVRKVLGKTNSKILSSLVLNVIVNSSSRITLDSEHEKAMDELKNFLADKVYLGSAKKEENKVRRLIFFLFDFFYNHPEEMTSYINSHPISEANRNPLKLLKEDSNERLRIICDYISSMTDRYAIEVTQRLLMPNPLPLIQ